MNRPADRLCIVCGAAVRNRGPRANTCSAYCTDTRDKRTGKRPHIPLTHESAVSRGTMTPRHFPFD